MYHCPIQFVLPDARIYRVSAARVAVSIQVAHEETVDWTERKDESRAVRGKISAMQVNQRLLDNALDALFYHSHCTRVPAGLAHVSRRLPLSV